MEGGVTSVERGGGEATRARIPASTVTDKDQLGPVQTGLVVHFYFQLLSSGLVGRVMLL